MKYTPEIITKLEPNQVFVFGSNQYGKHGAGSAKAAMNFGAIYGQPIGLTGQAYGIITKSFNDRSCTIQFIKSQIVVLYQFAEYRPELTFLVTKIGTALAGFSIENIADMFRSMELIRPKNIVLPIEFAL